MTKAMAKSVKGFHGLFFLLLRMLSLVFGGGQGSKAKQGAESDKQDTFVYSMY